MKKILSAVVLSAMLVAMSVMAFAAPSPTATDAEASALNKLGSGAEIVVADEKAPAGLAIVAQDATGAQLSVIEAVVADNENEKVAMIVDLVASVSGANYTEAVAGVQIPVLAIASSTDTVANFKAYTIDANGDAEEVTVTAYDADTKTLTVDMPHFSPLAIVRVENPGTGDASNTTPYIIAIVGCVAALGAVLFVGKKRA